MLKNPKVKCDKCQGHGKICYDDAIGISMPCGTCGGAGSLAFKGSQIASSLTRIKTWLELTGNELRLRKCQGGEWEARVFHQECIGAGYGETMEEALTRAFNRAIEKMNFEGVDATA